MPFSSHQLLVFSDLDGCLLDHFSYSYQAAHPALNKLKTSAIPLILTSSKTLAEIAELSAELELTSPFIVENGAGVIMPVDYFSTPDAGQFRHNGYLFKSFGTEYVGIVKKLHAIRHKYGFRFSGFSDMSSTELSELTGLSSSRAGKAKQRWFTEPVLWQDGDDNWLIFSNLLKAVGLRHVRGGRFIHISGGGDKGIALDWLRQRYDKETGSSSQVMVLGDSENDIGMLLKADYPVVVRSPVHEPPVITGKTDVIVTDKTGPAGWNDAVLDRLRLFENSRQLDE